jgi:hypothetical protein
MAPLRPGVVRGVRVGDLQPSFRNVAVQPFDVAVGTGFVTAPSLIQPLEVQPTSELMTVLPMVLIPVYLVPLSIVLHLASLAKLRREAVAGNGFSRAVAA